MRLYFFKMDKSLPVDKSQNWEICQLRKKYTQACNLAQPMC